MAEIVQIADIENALALKAIKEIETNTTKMANSADKEYQKIGKGIGGIVGHLGDLLKTAKETGSATSKVFGKTFKFEELLAVIKKLDVGLDGLSKGLSETAKQEALGKALDVQEADRRIKSLEGSIKALLGNSIPAAQEFGRAIRDSANELGKGFLSGKISAQQFNKEMATLNTRANRATKDFKDGFTQVDEQTKKSQVSLFKLGTTFDRIGARGAGGAIRIVDALKGIHPAAIVAAAGAIGVALAVKKIGEAFVSAAKKGVEFFKEVLKDSLETSKRFELLERQFLNLFGGSEEAVDAIFDHILERSVELGTDLSEISKLLLPEVSSIEELDKAFNLISTLQFAFGRTSEETFRAIKQGSAGLFRSLQEQFGLLGKDIDKIKELQEVKGSVTGLLEGVELFLDRTGRSFDVFENSLARIEGSFKALRAIAERTLGEPIRNELAKQLQVVLDFIEDNRDEIEELLFITGDAVSNIIGRIGEIGAGAGNLDFSKIQEILEAAEAAAFHLVGLMDDLVPEDVNDIPDAFLEALDFAERTILVMRIWLAIAEAIVKRFEFIGTVADTFLLLEEKGRGFAGGQFADPSLDRDRDQQGPSAKDFFEGLGADFSDIEKDLRALEELQQARRDDREAAREQKDANLELAASYIQASDGADALAEAETEAAEARKKITEATIDANNEAADRVADANQKLLEKQMDLEQEFADERVDIWQKMYDEIVDSAQDFYRDIEDAEKELGRDIEDAVIAYGRKVADLEIATAKERLDIEKDFRDKLADIRARADFDASEAIRNNDAVALRRIRRREQFELEQARRARDRDIRDANDKAEERRNDLKKWLEREIEDAEKAEERKQEDLLEAFERRNEDIKRQYDRELRDQQESERRRLRDLMIWRDREIQELNTWWDRKLRDFELRYKEELAILKKYEKLKLEALLEIYDQYPEPVTGGIPQPSNAPGGATTPGGGTAGAGGGGGRPSELERLRAYAIALANQLGKYYLISSLKSTQDINYLRQIIILLEKQIQAQGGTLPPQPTANQQQPTASPYASPTTSPYASTSPVTNVPTSNTAVAGKGGVNQNIGITMNDPSQLSPVQIAIIQQVVQEQIANYAIPL